MSPEDRSLYDCGQVADYQKIVVLLLDAGANLKARDSAGNTPLHWAACACGNQEVIELLISKGAQVDAKDRNEQTPLHRAAYHADAKTVAALVANGANITSGDVSGVQPLHFAAQVDHAEVSHHLPRNPQQRFRMMGVWRHHSQTHDTPFRRQRLHDDTCQTPPICCAIRG
jgi:ankyrin repeat protein